jgi:IS4 transposase
MVLSEIFERFVKRSPVSVMARALMEHALAPDAVDAVFAGHTERQYTRELLFSSVVNLMAMVVTKVQPSIHAAFQAVKKDLPVSITALYNKLNRTEAGIVRVLVRHTAERLANVIAAMGGTMPSLLPGFPVRIIDGNHLAATERRLEVLRGSIAGPLPGHALVVLDPELMLATHMIPCEDGHAQERSLTGQILDLVVAGEVWIADRNFCTIALLSGIDLREAFYVIRQHANLPILSAGSMRKRGRTETGEVWEQNVTIARADGEKMQSRRIVIKLDAPTRDGDTEMAILTNLSEKVAAATAVASLYRKRWTLETMFQSLTQMLEGEIAALGYPKAALLGFGVALAAFNVMSTVQAALRANFGAEHVEENVSGFYIANEIRGTLPGMTIVLEPEAWESYQTMKPKALAREMLRWSKHVDLATFKKHRRGPKTPVPKRTRFPEKTHVSTARLLAESRKKPR